MSAAAANGSANANNGQSADCVGPNAQEWHEKFKSLGEQLSMHLQ
jgi:hypothetical protein